MPKVTSGTASILASSPISEICPNSSKDRGDKARNTTRCCLIKPAEPWRRRCHKLPAGACRAPLVANSTATATKLSQKPACSSAQGSSASTTAAATASTACQGQCLPPLRSQATAASMQTVRCAGTPQPLKSAYAPAKNTPPHSATSGAGHHRHSGMPQRAPQRVPCRHSQPSTPLASSANRVMCSPEMLIKCATPVMRNTSQSWRSMADWSPITSAAITPARRCAYAENDAELGAAVLLAMLAVLVSLVSLPSFTLLSFISFELIAAADAGNARCW